MANLSSHTTEAIAAMISHFANITCAALLALRIIHPRRASFTLTLRTSDERVGSPSTAEAFPLNLSQYLRLDGEQKLVWTDRSGEATMIIPSHFLSGVLQNGMRAWVGACRLDLLDHILALNDRPSERIASEYVRYHHEDRTHLGLEKGTPDLQDSLRTSGRVHSQEATRRAIQRYNRSGLALTDFSRRNSYMNVPPRTSGSCPPASSCCNHAGDRISLLTQERPLLVPT